MAHDLTKTDVIENLGTLLTLRGISHLCQVGAVISGLSISQADKVWWLASQHYSREVLHAHFLVTFEGKKLDELFCTQALTWVSKSPPLFVRSGGAEPLKALRSALREVVALRSGAEPDDAKVCVQWSDFSWSLVRILVEDGHAGDELSALMLEHDLGL
ncbi:hypothetical protein [Pseudomonas bohemica]|uniref:hypothetical protein n=1 Tax=Pseudomonas bohemica TaxID=2044872 RepID=UPI000DA620DF|nr:hypothetical protein [Pseudomonas bohemica]